MNRKLQGALIPDMNTLYSQFASLSANAKKASCSEFIFGFCVGVWSIALNFHLSARGFDDAEIGLLLSLGFVVTAITSFFVGRLGDLKGYPFVMTSGCLLMSSSLIIISLANYTFMLYLGQIIYCMGLACVMTMEFPLSTSQVNESQKQFVYNLCLIMYFLGSILGSLICGMFTEIFSASGNPYLYMLLLCSIMYALLAAIRARLPRQKADQAKQCGKLDTLKDKKVLYFISFGFVTMFIFSLVTSMLNLVLRYRYFLSDGNVGIVFCVSSVIGCAALVMLPILTKYASLYRLSSLTMLLQLIVISVMAFAGANIFCLMAFLRTMTGNILYSSVDSPMLRSIDEDRRGTYAGLRVFSNYAGMSVASVVAGVIIARDNFILLFTIGAVFALIQNLIYHLLCAPYIKEKM